MVKAPRLGSKVKVLFRKVNGRFRSFEGTVVEGSTRVRRSRKNDYVTLDVDGEIRTVRAASITKLTVL